MLPWEDENEDYGKQVALQAREFDNTKDLNLFLWDLKTYNLIDVKYQWNDKSRCMNYLVLYRVELT